MFLQSLFYWSFIISFVYLISFIFSKHTVDNEWIVNSEKYKKGYNEEIISYFTYMIGSITFFISLLNFNFEDFKIIMQESFSKTPPDAVLFGLALALTILVFFIPFFLMLIIPFPRQKPTAKSKRESKSNWWKKYLKKVTLKVAVTITVFFIIKGIEKVFNIEIKIHEVGIITLLYLCISIYDKINN